MTSSLAKALNSPAALVENLPPLENGDRLTRPEFERRYQAMPTKKNRTKKAELIEGVVYMASPLRFKFHAEPHGNLIGWLWTYKAATPEVQMGIEPTIRLDIDNEPQPDGVLLISQPSGGKSTLSEEGYLEGAPELVVEIAASSAAIDLGDKKRAYRRSGVQEYLVWQVFDQKIDWFSLQDGDYISLLPNQGIICSLVFPGLWLDVAAMLNGDMPRVLDILQVGINGLEHQEFVQKLIALQSGAAP
ncbi:MAG: Uma2 family endonuclease [Coleofasciculaceae cyanobacterium SM2_1_6]|nr:Uma2 family endonuclease [Coleofasciculaceae cyanobacterium SM2_1_6]